MKTRKIMSSAAALFFAAAFFVSGVPVTQAVLSTNADANIIVGQQNMTSNDYNQDGNIDVTGANKLMFPRSPFFDGNKFFVADEENNRVLIYNSVPTSNDASADVVIGQADMTSNSENRGGTVAANTLDAPAAVFSDGTKLFIVDADNNRVLIYNSIPSTNGASADVVIGQADLTSNSANQGAEVARNTLNAPASVFCDGKKVFIGDWGNNRVLIFNAIPTASNASANVVIGQPDMASNDANQGGAISARTLYSPNGVWANGKKLFVADQWNHRVLIYNSIPTKNNPRASVVIGQPDMNSGDINQGGAVAANTLYWPTQVFPYGPKLLVLDATNHRLLVFKSIPTANNASANVVIGQPDMISDGENQAGTVAANTLDYPRGVFVNNSKLMIGDYSNQRVLLYNSFGPQWIINKGKSRTLSGGEKMKVQMKKIEFSGKKVLLKNGFVRIYRNGIWAKKARINKGGNWSLYFTDSGNAVKNFVIKYYNSKNVLQMNSETYEIGVNRGSLVLSSLEKMSLNNSIKASNTNDSGSVRNNREFKGIVPGSK